MAMDGILLHQIVTTIKKAGPLRINRIMQPSDHEFLFQCFGGKKVNLLISIHPVYSRIQFTQLKNATNYDGTHMLNLLRKHLDGGIIQSIEQLGFDRVFTLNIDHRDEMGVIRHNRLMIELMGKYANVVLVNDDGTVVDAIKRLSPFENSQRAIVPGAIYTLPQQFGKKTIHSLSEVNRNESLRSQIEGVSPLLEEEILYRLKTQSAETIAETILESDQLYIHQSGYHIIELTHLNEPFEQYPLMDGLDVYYRNFQEQAQIKAHTGDLLKTIKRELKRLRQKLPKLYQDLENALDAEPLRTNGDLLYAFYADEPSGKKSVTLNNWDGQPRTIVLDAKLSGRDNAKAYFNRYRKTKTSLSYLEVQIGLTEDRIQYFEGLESQTSQASVDDAKEIKEELLSNGVLFQKRGTKAVKKAKKPNYLTIEYDETTTIYVGKNNVQNEYITFKLSRKEDMWFHAANTFGAHVLIKSEEPLDESKIRLCAHLAAYYSKSRYGSSVEVHYTAIKNIKKIPGQQPGKVRITAQKSIFIDPDEQLVKSYSAQ